MSAAEKEQAAAAGTVRVSVPATSANLGVGFDVLGLALDLSAEFTFEPADALKIDGCAPELAGEDNLVWTSYLCGCRSLALRRSPSTLQSPAPFPRPAGLAPAPHAWLRALRQLKRLQGLSLDRERTLSLATAIEGHPDNVAPAVMGGLVSSYVEGPTTVTTRWVVADNLRFVCMAPPYRVLTRDARRALPAMVPTSTVSWQVGRCLAMVSAMAKGDPDAIRACCHDRIHEPYRAPLIPDYQMLHDVAHENGACTFLISGSGATMMAIADGDERAASVARAVSEAMPTLWVRTLRASEHGTMVRVTQ